MWKVTNEINKAILDDFRYKLIVPLLEEMIHYKQQCSKLSFIDYIKKDTKIKSDSSRTLINYLNKRRTKKIKFGDLIQSIIDKNSLNELKNNYKLFLFQNNEIDKNNYNIIAVPIIEEFTFLFVDFFYEKFFNFQKIWLLIDKNKFKKINFDRETFHVNFKKENNINVCPYCDIDTTISLSNNEIEHFLPKSKFPFLSMNAYNLISSCIACNKKPEGKGSDVNLPIYSPFNLQIGDKLKFDNDILKRKISLSTNDTKIENYLELLNLKSRYNSSRIYNIVEERAESIYNTINDIELMGHEKLTEKQIIDYIDKKCTNSYKKDSLSFAIRYAFNKYQLYLVYKRDKANLKTQI